MQIDFHHGATYVCARLSGFSPQEATIIATASQYVDDAVSAGTLDFDNGAKYKIISSAHKTLDYRNFEALADAMVWLPFHFLPGNGGMRAGEHPEGSFINKLICLPNSPVAQDLLRSLIVTRERRYALHRLGVTMHTYADTWAHQGFAGVPHAINSATDLTGPENKPDHSLMNRLSNFFVSKALPLGHGAVLSNPDKPFLKWGYTNGLGQRVERDNPRDFIEAADHMVKAMQCFRAGSLDLDSAPGLPEKDRATMTALINEVRDDDGDKRHAVWLDEIKRGVFSFGAEEAVYQGIGDSSWQMRALGTNEDGVGKRSYQDDFLVTDWKLFHDALQWHRFDVVHHILPEYGICAA